MARKNRALTVFSLSFLDIMSCGLGAVILFFVIINHATEKRQDDLTADVSGEIDLLETEVKLEELNRTQLKNTLAALADEIEAAQGRSERLIEELETERETLSVQEQEAAARRAHFNQLVADIQRLEDELGRVQAEAEEGGADVRPFHGEGDRQYLTGLRVGGQNILVLLDASASMLDDSIVNIIRRRNLPARQRVQAEKWQRALLTVDWLSTQFPADSHFQIATFNVEASAVLEGTDGRWIEVGERGARLAEASAALRQVVPENGTRLHAAFDVIKMMRPLPDNVYLITDSLPTQGRAPAEKRGTVTSRERERYFTDAIRGLPAGIPINVIMFPMEGDPAAPSEFWKLAVATGGSYLAPSEDWP